MMKVSVRQHQAAAIPGYLDGYIVDGPRVGLTVFLFEARPPWNERIVTIRQWAGPTLRLTLAECRALSDVLRRLLEEAEDDQSDT